MKDEAIIAVLQDVLRRSAGVVTDAGIEETLRDWRTSKLAAAAMNAAMTDAVDLLEHFAARTQAVDPDLAAAIQLLKLSKDPVNSISTQRRMLPPARSHLKGRPSGRPHLQLVVS